MWCAARRQRLSNAAPERPSASAGLMSDGIVRHPRLVENATIAKKTAPCSPRDTNRSAQRTMRRSAWVHRPIMSYYTPPAAGCRRTGVDMAVEHFDVVIVGAGLSGVGAGVHLHKYCPSKSYLILEGRPAMGGDRKSTRLNSSHVE